MYRQFFASDERFFLRVYRIYGRIFLHLLSASIYSLYVASMVKLIVKVGVNGVNTSSRMVSWWTDLPTGIKMQRLYEFVYTSIFDNGHTTLPVMITKYTCYAARWSASYCSHAKNNCTLRINAATRKVGSEQIVKKNPTKWSRSDWYFSWYFIRIKSFNYQRYSSVNFSSYFEVRTERFSITR